VGAGQPDLGQSGADRRLAADECGATGGTALLTVPVGEHRAFLGETIDVGRPVSHDTVVVGTDVVPTSIIPPHNQNIRLFGCHSSVPIGLGSVCLLEPHCS